MKWTKLALTTMTLATVGMCFTACDPPPDYDPEIKSDPEVTFRNFHTTPFALDGNALDSNEFDVLPDDWETIHEDTPDNQAHSLEATGIVSDTPERTFTGGGSKDINSIDNWRHTNGSTPDKNDILNAYAAIYTAADGDTIIYFGADRFSVEGDALLGFWLFQQRIVVEEDGTFSGAHQDGDLLVLVNFTKGGTTPVVQVLEWDPDHLEAENNLVVLDPSQGAKCGAAGLDACAITNDMGPTPAPWEYTPKSGPSGVFPEEAFFEGAINLSAFFGDANLPCFASFMAETRSSTSVTAVLKDFVLDSFQECQSDMTVTAGCTTKLEEANGRVSVVVEYSGEVCNTSSGLGGITLSNVLVEGPEGTSQNLGNLGEGQCALYSMEFEPSSTNSTDPSDATFPGGTVTASGTGLQSQPVTKTSDPFGPCPLCP